MLGLFFFVLGMCGQLPASPSDPLQDSQLLKPRELVKALSGPAGAKPVVLCVGYQVLYEGSHIAGARFVGPTTKPAGMEKLKQETKNLPRDKEIVLYCGCCPWNDCPNIRPAVSALEQLGFKNVKALYLPANLQQDWIDKGFPIEKGEDGK